MSGIEDQGLRPENVDRAPADAPETQDANTDADPAYTGHPSQAEGEDPADDETHADPAPAGHPSQAEGEDRQDGETR